MLNQTYKQIEVLVIDDGSTDRSYERILKIAAEDTRLKCCHQDNEGVASARNTGLTMASGEWVLFLDSDDFIYPEAIETLLYEANAHSCKLIVGKLILILLPSKISFLHMRKGYFLVRMIIRVDLDWGIW